ncbi:MAG: hypothetical protein KA206_01515 [Paludibacter sp.]|nr:hypothetical protein [Paludibacter sp.]
MNFLKIILLILVIGYLSPVSSQENNSIPDRTPEQEAARQTEKLQQELQLTPEQIRKAHEINLKYARARKVSNSRSESIQRIKDKETDLLRILDSKQRSLLQSKRYERSSFNMSENEALKSKSDNSNPNARSANETQRSTSERENAKTTSPRTTIQNAPTRTSSGSSKQSTTNQHRR